MNPGSPGSVTEKENTVQIAKIMYNRDDPSKVLAAVRKPEGNNPNDWGRLYRSVDYGVTWTEVIDSHISDRYFFDMETSPGNANTVYLSSHRLYKSTDFGVTWDDVTNNLTGLNIDASSDKSFIVIETAPVGSNSTYDDWVGVATNNQSVGGAKELFISTDGLSSAIDNKVIGATYSIPINRYNHSFEVGYNFNKVFFGGSGECIRYTVSLSEPINLLPYTSIHADIKDMYVPDYNGSNEFFVYAGTDGGAYKSESPSIAFSFINKNINVIQFHSIASSEKDNKIIGGTQDNSSMIFRNNAWYYTTVGGDGSDCEIDPSNSNYMFYDDYLNTNFHVSPNSGVNAKSISIVDAGGNIVVPIEISPHDNSIVYIGDDLLKYYNHNYEVTAAAMPGSLTSLSDYTHQNGTANYVLGIALSHQDPDKIYIATQGYYTEIVGGTPCIVDNDGVLAGCEVSLTWNDPTAYMSYNIFKTTDGGVTWTDVSPVGDLSGVIGEITGIAVSTVNDDQVWITYSGFERKVAGATLKNQNVFKTTNGGVDWYADFDASSNLPISYTNKVAYQDNTNDRVFIATDKGIFWKENGINWQQFSTGLPNCPITDINIDYCEGAIYASSYGRGAWRSPLPINTYDDIHITSNTTWNTDSYIESNVVIESGAILTITGGATISIAGGKKITIMRGARLNVSNATLTNSCEALWEGIEVWGYDDLGHPALTDVLSGAYPASASDHGVVYITGNSIIENAHNGISTSKYNEVGWSDPDYHGGIIVALGSTFRNNRRSAEFLSFGSENVSQFIACDFITDDVLNQEVIPYAHVSMWAVKGVLFMDNTFANTISTATKQGIKRGKGIYSEEATYDVIRSCHEPLQPCGCAEWVGNTFDGLYRGIEARSVGVDFLYPLSIDGNVFIGNERAILISSIGNIELVNNDIQVPDYVGVNCYGLYLEGSTNYHIENNFFKSFGSVTEDFFPNSGLFVANNSSAGTTIYRNHFEDMEIGIRSQNTNSGLQLRCNDFTEVMSKYNIIATSGSIAHQGNCIIHPASNIFSHDCLISNADFRLQSGVPGINYYYETGEAPSCYSSSINLILCNANYECESQLEDPCDEEEQLQMMIHSGNELEDLIEANYAKIDGGNTLQLLDDIEKGIVTKEQLNSIGPYLSNVVLQALIEFPTELTTSELLTILSDNSPLDGSVSEVLENSEITNEMVITELTETTLETEAGAKIIYSPMQELLAEIVFLENERSMYIQKGVNAYLKNKDSESAIFILSSEDSDWAKQKLAGIYFNIEDYEAASTILKSVNSDDPNTLEFKDFITTLIGIKSEGRGYTELSAEEEETMRNLNSKVSTVGIAAGNILRMAFSEDYPEIIDSIIEEMELKTIDPTNQSNEPSFRLYPNPASKLVYIDLFNIVSNCNIQLNVYDVTGRLVKQQVIGTEYQTAWVALNDMKSGIYLFELLCNETPLGAKQLIIE